MENNSLLIDQYLQNEMNAAEKVAFEKRLATDQSLQEELAIQQQIVKTAVTAGIKSEFSQAIKARIVKKQLIRWGIAIAIAVTAFIFYAIKNDLFTGSKSLPVNGRTKEIFKIDNAADTIIETRSGIVFAIPAHAFNSKETAIRLEIKTALTPYDIMQNGLSTMSNDRLLRTAGMFSINGYENDSLLSMIKQIAVSVPANKIDTSMQLFDGVASDDGKINWVNPVRVNNSLRTYDITQLDFYPPRYIPTLKALQKEYNNKKYTDSLYYSFSGYPYLQIPAQPKQEEMKDTVKSISYNATNKKYKMSLDLFDDQAIDTVNKQIPLDRYKSDSATGLFSYEIDPGKIGAIWNSRFNNTIIATKEFEERLRFLHSLCTSEYLDVYLKYIGQPLYRADQYCADHSNGETKRKFLEFAARKDGGVLIADELQDKLSIYFQQKYTAYKEAAAKTWAKYVAELGKMDSIADGKRYEQVLNDLERKEKDFEQEFCINLTDAYRQIGIKRSCNDTIVQPPPVYYNFMISTPGWKNLDAYVFDATESRESMSYMDPQTGKTATITYSEAAISIKEMEQYDRVLVYTIPDSLNSFERLNQEGNVFKAKLNSLFRYDVVVLAYKGMQAYFYKEQKLQPGDYSFGLTSARDEDVRAALQSYSLTKASVLHSEFGYQLFEQKEAIRQLQIEKDREFREKVAAAIFNCAVYNAPK